MNRQGFTLLEVLVILGIIGILIGIFGTSLIRSIRTAELREAATQIATDFRRARSQAQRGSTDVTIVAPNGTATGTYSVNGQAVTLPNGITLVCKTNCVSDGSPSVKYLSPYGELSAVGSVFTVRSPLGGITPLEIRVVGVTGKIILAEAS